MSINLSDIPNAVTDYLATQVVTTVAPVRPDVTDELQPGEEGTFSVTATNAAAPTGVRVVNIKHHLTITPGSVAKFIVPTSPPARSTTDPNDPTLVPGDLVDEMFLFPLDTALLVGESDSVRALKIKSLRVGTAAIKCHLHGDILEEDLFPLGERNSDGEREFTVS
jgi:hypothetical protein